MTPLARQLAASLVHEGIELLALPAPAISTYDYHGDLERDSFTSLELFRASRPRYAAERVFKTAKPSPPTHAMAFGSLMHTILFTPIGLRGYLFKKIDRRTRDGKRAEVEAKEKNLTIMSPQDWYLADSMCNAALAHPFGRILLEHEAENETPILFNCPDTGHPLKCKPDRRFREGIILDLKTTDGDVDPDTWGRVCHRFGYHRQAAMYVMGVNEACGAGTVKKFIHMVISKEPPHEVTCYVLDDRAMALGREQNLETIRELTECHAGGRWSGRWSDAIHDVSLPAYAYHGSNL
jgi:hypothetical protein